MASDARLPLCDCETCKAEITRKIVKGLCARFEAHMRVDNKMTEAREAARQQRSQTSNQQEN